MEGQDPRDPLLQGHTADMRALAAVSPRRSDRGFTLVELMITVVVIGILASLAYPSFMGSLRKGRRAEAFTALTAVQQAQERWRANNSTYASDLSSTPPAGLGLAATTAGGLYSISIGNTSATGYDAIATSVSGKGQEHDGSCAKLGVRMAGGNLSYGGVTASGTLSFATTNPCWNR